MGSKSLKDVKNLYLGILLTIFTKKNDAIGFLPTIPMPLFCLQKNGPKGEQITYFNFNFNINVHNFKHHEQKKCPRLTNKRFKKPAYLRHYRMRKHYYLVNNKIIIGLTR